MVSLNMYCERDREMPLATCTCSVTVVRLCSVTNTFTFNYCSNELHLLEVMLWGGCISIPDKSVTKGSLARDADGRRHGASAPRSRALIHISPSNPNTQ